MLEANTIDETLLTPENRPVRVLYSFPHKLGAGRICYIAWQQVRGLAAAGAEVMVFPGSVHRPVSAGNVTTHPTLARGKIRIPYRLLGTRRSCALHDWITARRLEKLGHKIDIVHTWPLGALHTLKTAARLQIPTVLERPNAHTRFAYEVVQRECNRLGVRLPPGSEHAFDAHVLRREEAEYELAVRLLCPSEFTARTFRDQGFSTSKLVRHQYGYDPTLYFADNRRQSKGGLTILFVGVCAVRKGLHFALEAWLKSPAHEDGTFLIAGKFLPAYAEKVSAMLSHPSVHVLGHRDDVPTLMRSSDILILPSIEEGFGLVCADALGSGCVPLVSEACTDFCKHMENALVHRPGDVNELTRHLTILHQDRSLLERLRQSAVTTAANVTWDTAGIKLLQIYRQVIAANANSR
jgi:glycosyltransferase involved in cell wall biosynthesis